MLPPPGWMATIERTRSLSHITNQPGTKIELILGQGIILLLTNDPRSLTLIINQPAMINELILGQRKILSTTKQ